MSAVRTKLQVSQRSAEVTMADVFSLNNARALLKDKFILLIGDSNMRAFYKDLLCLLHKGGITPEMVLRRGSENASQYGDEILDIASTKYGRSYFEIRECKEKDLWVRFIFVTQAAAPSLLKELERLEEGRLPPPDIVVLNSCLWDITRWGPEQEDQYKENVAKLFHRFQRLLPPSALVMWTSSLPVATERVKGGVFIQQIEFIKHSMRFMLLEANLFIHNLCRVFGFSFLDLHYYMQYQLNRRTNDGLHWEPPAIRYITNLILTHIGLSFNEPLPGNVAETFLLQNHEKAREISLEDGGRNIYLDSKIVKYLKKLGIEMQCLADQTSPSEGKTDAPQKRVKWQARRTGRDNIGGNKKRSNQLVPNKIQPLMPGLSQDFLSNSMSVGHRSHCIPSWERKPPSHGLMGRIGTGQLCAGMQVDGAPGQYFTNCGPSEFVQGPQQEFGIEPRFSNMAVAWPLENRNQHPMNRMPSHRSCHQRGQQQFNFNPSEFWKDYPVDTFPWNWNKY